MTGELYVLVLLFPILRVIGLFFLKEYYQSLHVVMQHNDEFYLFMLVIDRLKIPPLY